MQDLARLFEPNSVAIVGATTNPYTVTNVTFLRQLLDFGYPGRIYPVNPHASEILGLKAYPSISAIPERVDYVVCAIAAPQTPKLMQECVATGVRLVAMYTAGFSESGEEGEKLEKEVVAIARQGGVRVLGPNCLGIHCPKAGLSLAGSISRESGHVGLLSQSGGNTQHMILGLAESGIYASKAISFGNAADLNESDLLEYLAQDDETSIIGIYIEGIKEPARFARVLKQTASTKPVIVVKGGKTPAGSGAVRLHTGALAGSRRVWDALCGQAGIVQAGSLKELIGTIQAFVYLKPPRGRRVGIIGIGGGANVLATDECETAGLVVPELPPNVRDELRAFTPAAGTGLRNPVDTLGEVYVDPAVLSRTVSTVGGWSGIDVLLVSFPMLLGVRLGVQFLIDGIQAVARGAKETGKPVAVILQTADCAEGESVAWDVQKRCLATGMPAFWTYGEAARAVKHLIDCAQRGTPRRSPRPTGAAWRKELDLE
ncbi:MAG: CoA-binding protein [Dehalococcoidia bacterium]|nr:CoA-binding protein [Dehalococcoidia bacterium]